MATKIASKKDTKKSTTIGKTKAAGSKAKEAQPAKAAKAAKPAKAAKASAASKSVKTVTATATAKACKSCKACPKGKESCSEKATDKTPRKKPIAKKPAI